MSDDITGDLDLLGDWLDAKGYTEEAGLCTRAMDEINKLRAALSGAAKELEFVKVKTQYRLAAKAAHDAAAALKETGDES